MSSVSVRAYFGESRRCGVGFSFGVDRFSMRALAFGGPAPFGNGGTGRDRNFSVLPRYWVCENEVWSKLEDAKWPHEWLMGWRGICRATDERTMVGGVFPLSGVGNNLPIWLADSTNLAYLPAVLSSHVCDFAARFKVGGVNLNFFIAEQLPVLPPQTLDKPAPWQPDLSLAEWLTPRILELTYTAEDLRPFAEDMGYDGPPFVWDEERRFQLRAELDAAFFHLYLPANPDGTWKRAKKETDAEYRTLCTVFPTPRHAVDYIMETFPIVKKKDEKAYGRYRTKEAILREYDTLAHVM